MPFDDLEIGQVIHGGEVTVEHDALAAFIAAFAPGWAVERGAPDSMVYALWSRLDEDQGALSPRKRVGVDALRWARNPPVGEVLRVRLTVMGKDAVGEGKGIIISQHDLLDGAGRLVFSCLTRSVYAR